MPSQTRVQWIRRLGVATVAMTFALMVLGSWVKATGSGLACPDWPQCYGEWLPPFPSADNGGTWQGESVVYSEAQVMYEWGHRLLASLLAPVLLAFAIVAVRGRELHPAMRFLPGLAGIVLVAQILLGGLTVLQKNEAWATTLHLATATFFFFLVSLATAFAYLRPLRDGVAASQPGSPAAMGPGGAAGVGAGAQESSGTREETHPAAEAAMAPQAATQAAPIGRPTLEVVRDYVTISKPRIILLLLIVAWAAMFVAAQGLPRLIPFLAVTAAGTFSTAASGAFNHVLERERDLKMRRTDKRPVALGRIHPASAVVYGAVMTCLAFLSLAAIEAWLAALLTMAAVAYYVGVYTMWLKPTTPQSIVIGGLAGSFPAVIGWSAVTGGLGWPAIILAGIVFLWTPAHFWALALLYKEDYAAADYPMLPNTAGENATRRRILIYSVLTVLASLMLVYPLGDAGLVYLLAGTGLGLLLVWRAGNLETSPSRKAYRSFFLYTIQYLGLLFVALMVDQVAFRPIL